MNRSDLVKKARAAANQVLQTNGYITAVDVLLVMGRLSKENYERWRFRQVPHLEKVLPGSLNEHTFFCRELRAYARDVLKLKPSHTAYTSWGKGRRQPLRFSKYGAPYVEELFSTHYVSVSPIASKKANRAKASAKHSKGPFVAELDAPATNIPYESL
jgi:hypothetical protein